MSTIKHKLSEEEYLQLYRKQQVDEFLRSKYTKKKFPEIVLAESNPVNLELVSPSATKSTITEIKVSQNKETIRKELPKLLSNLKTKGESNKNPKILIQNKYKLFIENYEQ
jgi:hypothetical protein